MDQETLDYVLKEGPEGWQILLVLCALSLVPALLSLAATLLQLAWWCCRYRFKFGVWPGVTEGTEDGYDG
jgi:hypothetical protein